MGLILFLLAAVGASFWLVLPTLGPILWPVRVAVLILALLVFCWIQLDQRRRRYTVTNKRVAVDYGIINRISNEVRISDVRSINLQKTGFTGLLGIGRGGILFRGHGGCRCDFLEYAGGRKGPRPGAFAPAVGLGK